MAAKEFSRIGLGMTKDDTALIKRLKKSLASTHGTLTTVALVRIALRRMESKEA